MRRPEPGPSSSHGRNKSAMGGHCPESLPARTGQGLSPVPRKVSKPGAEWQAGRLPGGACPVQQGMGGGRTMPTPEFWSAVAPCHPRPAEGPVTRRPQLTPGYQGWGVERVPGTGDRAGTGLSALACPASLIHTSSEAPQPTYALRPPRPATRPEASHPPRSGTPPGEAAPGGWGSPSTSQTGEWGGKRGHSPEVTLQVHARGMEAQTHRQSVPGSEPEPRDPLMQGPRATVRGTWIAEGHPSIHVSASRVPYCPGLRSEVPTHV